MGVRNPAEAEKEPAVDPFDVLRRTLHQVVDVQQVAEDVVAVVADERIAVHQQRPGGADREQIEHGRPEGAGSGVHPAQRRQPAEDQFHGDSGEVDHQPFPARQPPRIRQIREQTRIKDDETHPHRAHPAAVAFRDVGVGQFVQRFRDQERPEVVDQPRPRQGVDEGAADLVELAQQQHVTDQRSREDRIPHQWIEEHPHKRHGSGEKPVRMKRRQLEEQIGTGKPFRQGSPLRLPELPGPLLHRAVLRQQQIVGVQKAGQGVQLRRSGLDARRLEPGRKFVQLIVAVHQRKHRSGARIQLVIVIRNRVEQHRVIPVLSRRDQFDVPA